MGLQKLTGMKFGKLTVIERVKNPNEKSREKTVWKCMCDCGNICYTISYKLKTGHTQSCGCIQKEILSLRRKEYGMKSRKGIHSVEHMVFNEYKRNAKSDNKEFLLTEDDFINLIHKECVYCGGTNTRKNTYTKEEYILNGIDRIDSSLGYTLNNVVPCCKRCNISKHNYSEKEFLEWVKIIYNNLSNKGLI